MTRIGWRYATLWMTVVVVLPSRFLACGGGDEDGSGPADRFGRDAVVRIGYANEAPFAYYDNESGRLTGESVEVTRHVFKKMGVSRVEGIITEFASLIPGLKAYRFDIIATGMWIIPPRCQQINFSEPISCLGQGFIVKAGNPLNLHSYEDVARHSTARLGVVGGGVELKFARAFGIPEERISIFPDAPSSIAAIQAGRVDACAASVPTHKDLLAKADDSGLERALPFVDRGAEGLPSRLCSAIGFRKEDEHFLREFNGHLETFIGSGEHLEMIEPFGFTEAELPNNITTEELCQECLE